MLFRTRDLRLGYDVDVAGILVPDSDAVSGVEEDDGTVIVTAFNGSMVDKKRRRLRCSRPQNCATHVTTVCIGDTRVVVELYDNGSFC